MPEGDTVFLAATRLHRALAGRTHHGTDFRVPALRPPTSPANDDGGRPARQASVHAHRCRAVDPHPLQDGRRVAARAGGPPGGEPRRRGSARRSRPTQPPPSASSSASSSCSKRKPRTRVGHLGPDLLGPDWDAAEALVRLAARPGRPIGEALLDQSVMAGIGNIFKCEICFLRGVEPATAVGEVRDLEAVVGLARRLLLANRATGNQVTTGDPRRGRSHWVYGRGGEPCRRCGARIQRRIDGRAGEARERVTYWCPSCQPRAGVSPRTGTSPRSRSGTATRSPRPRR